ncbi:MAG: Wzz/FepE/Etk N-terminal domain-containing protein [Bacteroidales bacterium]|nr:Wzz/FepE/Etk N-terminal domain-containing protein [Bacteroidales bacterium]
MSNIFQSNSEFIYILKKYKKVFIIVTISSLILFTFISIILPKEYRAEVIIFPAVNESVTHSVFSENLSSKGVTKFGDSEDIEYYLQILKSEDLRNYITQKFNLYKHYEIDTIKDKYPKTKLKKKWEDNIQFRKKQFLSIEIAVYDKDPVFAAILANSIAEFSDSLINKIKQERAKKVYNVIFKEYENAIKFLKTIQDSLNYAREHGVYNFKAQSEMYSKAYAEALSQGNIKGARLIEEKLNLLKKYGSIYQTYDEILTYEAKRISNFNEKLSQLKIDAEEFVPYKFTVSKATIPEKAHYPIYWLIISCGLLFSLLLTFFILVIIEKYSKIKC